MTKQAKPRPVAGKKPAKAIAKAASGKPRASSKPVAKAKLDKKASGKIAQAAVETVKQRVKLVRDSFTMPREDFDRIARLKERAIDFKRPAKKSELLRAGLQTLERLDDASLHAALDALQPIKTGRPKKRH